MDLLMRKHTARIENDLIFQGQYTLTPRDQKIVLYLISKINPMSQDDFIEQLIPIKELEQLISPGKKYGSIYTEMERFSDSIISKHISFPTNFKLNGRRLRGKINWFQSVIPVENDAGELCLRFLFSSDLKPFLLDLNKYTQISIQEVLPLQSGFSIRLFQLFRSYRNRMKVHQKSSRLNYSIEDLKSLLGIEGKYADYRNFKKNVLDIVVKEINKHTSIKLTANPLKSGRRVTSVDFIFSDKKAKGEAVLSESVDISDLSFAQKKAFDNLVAYGVNDGPAKRMVTMVKASEMKGFEDLYFKNVMQIFEEKTNSDQGRAGVLVKWFIDMKVFEQGDMFSKIMETLATQKKNMVEHEPEKWENRMDAKDITYLEFKALKTN